jgi:hypothetical protein
MTSEEIVRTNANAYVPAAKPPGSFCDFDEQASSTRLFATQHHRNGKE